MGVDVLLIGPLPTPGVAYITRSLRADAGIVLTASHNSYEDNGIKFFRDDGYKLDDAIEKQIEHLVFSGAIEDIRPTAEEIGKAMRIDDALGRYVEFAKAAFPKGMTLEGLRVVVDTATARRTRALPACCANSARTSPCSTTPPTAPTSTRTAAARIPKSSARPCANSAPMWAFPTTVTVTAYNCAMRAVSS